MRQFHDSTLAALADLVRAAGLAEPKELRPSHLLRRLSATEVRSFAELYTFLEHRELLTGTRNRDYAEAWAQASVGGFAPAVPVRSAA